MSLGHAPRDQEIRDLRVEVGHLRRGLRQRVHIKEHRNPSPSPSSNSRDEQNYRQRTRSPQSSVHEAPSHSLGGECHPHRRNRTPPPRAMGGDAMSTALCQVSWSPFSRHIEDAEILYRFTPPTFIMYNGKIDSVKHVSHFNQRMVIHSRTKVLMRKVFPSSINPTAMRWWIGREIHKVI